MASSSFTFLPPGVRYFKPSLFVPTSLQTLASTGMRQHCIRMRRHLSSLTTEDPHLKPLSAISGSKSGSKTMIASKEDLVVLGIETSCDDTAAAVVRGDGVILGQVVSSQEDLLERYGGVDPKMAGEPHSLVIDQVLEQAIQNANLTENSLSAGSVTIGPGLSLCLQVGVRKARSVAGKFGLPIVGIHHMEAHALIARIFERDLHFPFLVLLVSGGHNLIIVARDLGHYIQLGTTIDDAIGEAYDKTARLLGLDLRKGGGLALEQLHLKIPMKQYKDCNFSYAGLKTQTRKAIEKMNVNMENCPISQANNKERKSRADIAASFQRVSVLHLEDRVERAIEWTMDMEPSIKHLVISGGVASNQYIRERLGLIAKKKDLQLICPPSSLCTDNGVMVAWTGIEHFCLGRFEPPPPANEPEDYMLDLRPRWPLGEEYLQGRSDAPSIKRARVHPSLTSIIQASLQH